MTSHTWVFAPPDAPARPDEKQGLARPAPPTDPPLLAMVDPDTTRSEVSLVGELDLVTSALLIDMVDELLGSGLLEVRIDLSQLDFCDITGLRTLLRSRQRLTEVGGRLVLLRPRPQFVRIAEIIGWSAELGVQTPLEVSR